MHTHILLASGLSAFMATALVAQNCSDNTHRISLVDAQGAPVPQSGSPSLWRPGDERVYMAFPASLPTGLYYVHVTDPIGGHDEVLSMNDPADRFVHVTNTAGVITLALPYSVNPDLPAFGSGLGGVGQSLPLFPFRSASWDPCNFKAWLGDCWSEPINPNNPYLLRGGFDAAEGVCCVRSYERFSIGDGTGADVSGLVFDDVNRDGDRDAGEAGLPGIQVRLVTPTTSTPTSTDGSGEFRFVDVGGCDYLVDLVIPAGWTATTPTSYSVEACGCADVRSQPFGLVREVQNCDGHTIGYWRNKHGLQLVQQHNLLAAYPGLCIVDGAGNYVSFANLDQYKAWLQAANAVNMAYMLSAQMVGMYNNVSVGFVGSGCRIHDLSLGDITIHELLQQARASLCAHPYTPSGSPFRAEQTLLKNALDAANNNQNWL